MPSNNNANTKNKNSGAVFKKIVDDTMKAKKRKLRKKRRLSVKNSKIRS